MTKHYNVMKTAPVVYTTLNRFYSKRLFMNEPCTACYYDLISINADTPKYSKATYHGKQVWL